MGDVDGRDHGSRPTAARHVAGRRRGGFGRWWRIPALAGLVIVVGVLVATLPGRRGWFDIAVYYQTVKNWPHDPAHLYDFVRPGTRFGFTYPPFAALCMVPMAWLSWDAAVAINLVITVIASAYILYVLLDPIVRREGLNRRHFYVVAGCVFLLFGPVRETFEFGQINLVLVALVYADLFMLQRNRSRWVGIGIGLAAAIKLTPAIFIVYFLVTRRWRAAAISAGTMIAATALAAAVAPAATVAYFTKAMWNTDRIGGFSDTFNQSLMGVVARWNPARPNHLLWAALVAAVLCVWVWRIRSAHAAGDDRAGFALTGVTACLISPITWVHHLVWLLPALIILAESALPSISSGWRQRRRLVAAIGIYVAFFGSVAWIWSNRQHGLLHVFAEDFDVLISVAMLLWLPIKRHADIAPDIVPDIVPDIAPDIDSPDVPRTTSGAIGRSAETAVGAAGIAT